MMRNRNKIFYPADFISLILLPLLCIWNLNKQKAFEKIGALEVAYFYHNELEEYSNLASFKKAISSRNYIDIEFTGNKQDDKIILQYAHIKIKNLIKSKDTITGVHFKFTEKAKYWNFVKAIDICQVESLNPLMDKNDIWVAYYPPTPNTYSFICGSFSHSDFDAYYPSTPYIIPLLICGTASHSDFDGCFKLIKEKVDNLGMLPKVYMLPLLVFLLMCFFSFRKILQDRLPRRSSS